MALLTVYRNQRQNADYIEYIVNKIWNSENAVNHFTVGCFKNEKAVISTFKMTQNMYSKVYGIRAHTFSISFDPQDYFVYVEDTVKKVLEYFKETFQVMCTITREGNIYVATFVCNSVSYRYAKKFKDNNLNYIQFLKDLRVLTGKQIAYAPGVLYDGNHDNSECYEYYS